MVILRHLAMVLAMTMVIFSPASVSGAGTPPVFQGASHAFTVTEGRPALPELAFEDGLGRARSLRDMRGKVVLLNLWATWCAPCVKEMPSLDRLQAAMAGEDFEVVALSLDRGGRKAVQSFFEKTGIRHLAPYLDPKMTAMKELKPEGLPTTILIDREGREIGRLPGEAEWNSPEARAFLDYFLNETSRSGS